jgi:hypothetical protein
MHDDGKDTNPTPEGASLLRCENCERTIGRLETPWKYGEYVLCAECAQRFMPPSPPEPQAASDTIDMGRDTYVSRAEHSPPRNGRNPATKAIFALVSLAAIGWAGRTLYHDRQMNLMWQHYHRLLGLTVTNQTNEAKLEERAAQVPKTEERAELTTKPVDPTTELEQVKAAVAQASDAEPTAKAELERVKAAVAKASDAALHRLRATDQYKSLATQREAARGVLEKARGGDDRQAKLAASREFVRIDQAVKKMESDAIASDPAVASAEQREADLRGAIADLDAKMQAAKKAIADAIANSPINVAVREHRIIKGMTEHEAADAMVYTEPARNMVKELNAAAFATQVTQGAYHPYIGPKWIINRTVAENGDGGKVIEWNVTLGGYSPVQHLNFPHIRTVRASFKEGRVIEVVDVKEDY